MKIDLLKENPFLGFFGGFELEKAAQVMWDIYKETGRTFFVKDDFSDSSARAGFYEWGNAKYLIEKDGVKLMTPKFFDEIESKLKLYNPDYLNDRN